jgi:hypothetical protein
VNVTVWPIAPAVALSGATSIEATGSGVTILSAPRQLAITKRADQLTQRRRRMDIG